MDIKLNEEEIQKTINESMSTVVGDAISSYEVRQALTDRIAKSAIYDVLGQAIDKALENLDIGQLQNKLAAEMLRAITASIINILHEGLASLLLDIKKIPDYDREARARARQEILTTLRRKP